MAITDERLRQMVQSYQDYGYGDTAAALRELLALREQNRWIPVTEELPDEEGPCVLVEYNDLAAQLSESEEDGVHEWYRGTPDIANPLFISAHTEYIKFWRPLPAPPVEGGSRG